MDLSKRGFSGKVGAQMEEGVGKRIQAALFTLRKAGDTVPCHTPSYEAHLHPPTKPQPSAF